MVYITKEVEEKILNHCRKDYPKEACGILAGKEGEITFVYPMLNTDDSSVSYFMDPHQQLSVMKDMRKRGLEMLGIYHSHPHSLAYPSAKDVDMAFYKEAVYFIISLVDKECPQIRAFRIENKNIKEEEVMVKDVFSQSDLFSSHKLSSLIHYQDKAVVSKTLINKKTGTVTLFAFDKGEGLSEHTAPFDALVYIIEGEAEIMIAQDKHILKHGDMIIMPANKPHSLKARTPFKMLLIMIRE